MAIGVQTMREDRQDTRIWVASISIGVRKTLAQNGGTVRGYRRVADHALRSDRHAGSYLVDRCRQNVRGKGNLRSIVETYRRDHVGHELVESGDSLIMDNRETVDMPHSAHFPKTQIGRQAVPAK